MNNKLIENEKYLKVLNLIEEIREDSGLDISDDEIITNIIDDYGFNPVILIQE